MRRAGWIVLLAFATFAAATAVAAAHPEPGDVDGDGVRDEVDNCVRTLNGDQLDADADRIGDRCDPDPDNDGVPSTPPYHRGVGDDNCPTVPNPGQEEAPQDPRFGVACYVDSDRDRHPDPLDNCPTVVNAAQDDYDYDRTGDICDPDDDEDGEFDTVDNCQFTYNYDQADADRDGRGDVCDDTPTGGGPGGGDGGGGSGGGGSGGGGTTDRKAPTVRLGIGRTAQLAELGAGLAVRVRCNEGCALQGRLTVNRATARRLRIGRRKTTVAQGTAALAGKGTTYVFMRFKRGMTRRLTRGPAVRAQLSLTAADDAGNRRTAARALRLR
jgi:Thrombospondin type 3 repeat